MKKPAKYPVVEYRRRRGELLTPKREEPSKRENEAQEMKAQNTRQEVRRDA